MARGRGRGKSSNRSNPAVRVSMPTIPMPTIVSPQQGGTLTVETPAQSTAPTISETHPVTPNSSNPICQGLSTQNNPTVHSNTNAGVGMARGRGLGKSTNRSNPAVRVSIPTIPMPTIVSPQQVGTLSVETPAQSTPPTISETLPVTPVHINTTAEGDSSNCHTRTLIFLTSAGLEPSKTCSNFISKSFRNYVDPNGINWKRVSNDVRDGYFGEFKKKFYWDVSISENEVKRHWLVKATVNYRNFIFKIKGEGVRPGFVTEHVWERWMQLWGSDECIKKSEINAKNRRGGREVAAGTHTGGSISIGEYRKKLAIEKGRDPTPAELHLHVRTHDHDGKSFVDERSRIVHEKYEEILREKTVSQVDIDQYEAYYQAAGGEKRRRIYGLGSEANSYYGKSLCDVSTSVPSSVSQSTSTTNMDEFVKKMLPALTNHFLPVVIDRVQEVITPIDNPSVVSPAVPPATTNLDEVDN